jgi:hypothetical protein
MTYIIDGVEYNVIIEKKRNKNTYIRVKPDMSIFVTTSYFTTKKYIKKLLDENKDAVIKMLNRQSRVNEKSKSFFYLGTSYDIIEVATMKDIEIDGKYIYIPNKKKFEKWLKKQMIDIFTERLKYNFDSFDEVSSCPILKIRTMKTRWGVYNRVKHSITLNSRLLEYGLEEIDYVIIHELSHVIHFNHSTDFWKLVEKYCPKYKEVRKRLKE